MKIVFTGNVFPFGEGFAYGGERILQYLIQDLSMLGHDIYLFAREGTQINSKYVKDYIPVGALQNDVDVHFEAVKTYMENHNIDFDIYQCNYFGDGWNPEILDLFNYVELVWNVWCHMGHQLKQKPFNTVSYSKVLQNDFRAIGMDTTMIHYGIPEDLYKFQPDKENYACWIGKVEGGKYPKAAAEIAKAAGLKLVIMGPPYNTGCFFDQVAPYIDNQNVFWVRGVDDKMKYEIMSKAKCFLYTNDNSWKEHFGIVIAEALAMGTPVIACNRVNQDCSVVVDKLITDGENGFVLNYKDSKDLDFMVTKGVELISKLGQIDVKNCRESFEKRFTSKLMARRYEYMYQKINDGSRFNELTIPF